MGRRVSVVVQVERMDEAAAEHQEPEAIDAVAFEPVSYTHLRAHETVLDLVCRLLLEKKNFETRKHNYKHKGNDYNVLTGIYTSTKISIIF